MHDQNNKISKLYCNKKEIYFYNIKLLLLEKVRFDN